MKADFVRWASAAPSWAAGSDLGPVVSSRVRVARNLAGVPFPHNASPTARKQVLQQVFAALKAAPGLDKAQTFQLSSFSTVERTFLMERHLMSHQHAMADGDRGLVVAPAESTSIMVNEEDHIRAATFRPGLDLAGAWESLVALDDGMAAALPIAFDAEFGFITACPTNLGTGLRASALLHLPALALTGRIRGILGTLPKAGLTARGFYGEGTSSLGDLIQLSNSLTMGNAEAATVRAVEKAVRQISALEARAAADLAESDLRSGVEDRAHRTWGTLTNARLLEQAEGMKCLSLVRFGLRLGLEIEASAETVNGLMFLAQPAHLSLTGPRGTAGAAEPAQRAAMIRNQLARTRG